MSKKIHLNIGGMTCINCQNKISKKLRAQKGVLGVEVSYAKGTADVEFDEATISRKDIEGVIEKLDYKVLSANIADSFDVAGTASILVIIVALYYMLQNLGLLNRLVPKSLADSGMGYGMLFVTGLITSVHCIAMCGGIGLSQSLTGSDKSSGKESIFQTLRPSLSYNLGRVCSYTLIGFVLGLVGMILSGGTSLGISPVFQGVLKLLAGLFMVVMGINMLGIFPWLRKFTLHPPRFITRFVGSKAKVASGPSAVGLLNGLMPCGPLQSMWIVALASANPLTGALSMFIFSLGTVPLMMGLGSFVSVLGKKFTDQVRKVGAVLVVVLGLALASQGGALSGWLEPELLLYLIIALFVAGVLISIPSKNKWVRYGTYVASFLIIAGAYGLWKVDGLALETNASYATVDSTTNGTAGYTSDDEQSNLSENNTAGISGESTEVGESQSSSDVQVVNSTLTLGRYPDITVQAGVPVKWIIDVPRESLNGCNYTMIIPAYGIEHAFDVGENIIEFTPTETGLVRYSCWMGMVFGSINVVDG